MVQSPRSLVVQGRGGEHHAVIGNRIIRPHVLFTCEETLNMIIMNINKQHVSTHGCQASMLVLGSVIENRGIGHPIIS